MSPNPLWLHPPGRKIKTDVNKGASARITDKNDPPPRGSVPPVISLSEAGNWLLAQSMSSVLLLRKTACTAYNGFQDIGLQKYRMLNRRSVRRERGFEIAVLDHREFRRARVALARAMHAFGGQSPPGRPNPRRINRRRGL